MVALKSTVAFAGIMTGSAGLAQHEGHQMPMPEAPVAEQATTLTPVTT